MISKATIERAIQAGDLLTIEDAFHQCLNDRARTFPHGIGSPGEMIEMFDHVMRALADDQAVLWYGITDFPWSYSRAAAQAAEHREDHLKRFRRMAPSGRQLGGTKARAR